MKMANSAKDNKNILRIYLKNDFGHYAKNDNSGKTG
jgi:hypothetical protein